IAPAAPARSNAEAVVHARGSSRRKYQATRVPEAANEATTPDAWPEGGSRSAGSGRSRALAGSGGVPAGAGRGPGAPDGAPAGEPREPAGTSRRSGSPRGRLPTPTTRIVHAISAKTQATMWAR